MTGSRIFRTTVFGSLLIVVTFVILSCGSSDEAEPTLAPSSTAAPLPGRAIAEATGVESLDRVVNALFASDTTQLDALVQYKDLPCQEHPLAASGAPSCSSGEREGTSIETLRVGGCEGRTATRAEVQDALRTLVAPPWRLYAIYQGSDNAETDADYTIVLSTPGTSAQHAAGAPSVQANLIFERAGQITGLDFACGQPIAQRLGGTALLPPE